MKWNKRQEGFSLLEVVMILVVLSVAVIPISNLLRINLISSVKNEYYTKATFYAQQRLEEILADYKAPAAVGRGYDHASDVSNYPDDSWEEFARSVSVTTGTLNGVDYAEVTVTVSKGSNSPVVLTAWLVQ